ncbi:MAG TPA: hypothetical protein VMV10_05850 [Pirellulales bacterium]|nr:hypothetical protein [Pirellulales bacterium]
MIGRREFGAAGISALALAAMEIAAQHAKHLARHEVSEHAFDQAIIKLVVARRDGGVRR